MNTLTVATGYRQSRRHVIPVSSRPTIAIDVYKRDVDRTLIRVNLKLTTDERVRKRISALRFAEEVRRSRTPTLIQLKRAAGRPKDLERIAELEAIVDERRTTSHGDFC